MKTKGPQGNQGGFVQNKSDGPPDVNGAKKFDSAKFNRRLDLANNAFGAVNGAFDLAQNLKGAKDLISGLLGGGGGGGGIAGLLQGGPGKLAGLGPQLALGALGGLGQAGQQGMMQIMQGLMQVLSPLMKMLGGGAQGLGGMGGGAPQGVGQGLCNQGAQQLLPQLFQKIMGMQQGLMGIQQGIMGLQQGLMNAAQQGLGKVAQAPMMGAQALSGAAQGLMGTAQGLMGAAQGIMGALQQGAPGAAHAPTVGAHVGGPAGLEQGLLGVQKGLQKVESGLMDMAVATFGTLGGPGAAAGKALAPHALAPQSSALGMPMGHGPVQQPPVNITVNQLVFN